MSPSSAAGQQQEIAVLFVCLGNICRSPMAEAVFTHLVSQRRLPDNLSFRIDSAGTAGYHVGDQPDHRTVECCRKRGVPVNHRGRQLIARDFHEFHYVLCMDDSNLSNAKRIMPKERVDHVHVGLLGHFDPEGQRIIEDPYYGGMEEFEVNFQQCMRSCQALLDHILVKKLPS